MDETYRFANGVLLRRRDLLQLQLDRYAAEGNPNLHEPEEEGWLLKVWGDRQPPRPLFLDVGAAVGYYAVLLRRTTANCRVVAVEALPEHVEAFQSTWALNGLSTDGVALITDAVAPEDGTVLFLRANYGSGITGYRSDDTVEVRARSMRRLLDECGAVHLMKMDIQGAELDVLGSAAGILAEHVEHMIIGTHGPALHTAVERLLVDAGYDIRHTDPAPPHQPDGLIVATRMP